MEDFAKSIKAYLYDKTSSPLFGAFLLSWLIWNFRLVLISFSSISVFEKIDYIEMYFSGNYLTGYLIHSIIAPGLLTLFYIYVYPVISIPIYKYALNIQAKMRQHKEEFENSKRLTVQQSRAIMLELSLMKKKYDEDLSQAQTEIGVLRDELSKVTVGEKKNSSLEDIGFEKAVGNSKKLNSEAISHGSVEMNHKDKRADKRSSVDVDNNSENQKAIILNEDQMELMIAFRKHDDWIAKNLLYFDVGYDNKHRMNKTLNELTKLGLIETTDNNYYQVTHKGSEFIVNNF